MGKATTYLYGDSTPSPLETDFIAFLRDAFDFGAQVLECDTRIAEAMRRVTSLSEETEREIEAAEAFAVDVSRALETADVGSRESIAARCAVRIRQGAQELVQSEAESARAAVNAAKSRAANTAATERDSCFKALEGLLLRHTLPESRVDTRLRIDGSGYEAQLSGVVPYGLEWTVSLAIPEGHALASVLRVERVVARLEVEAPEEAGWIHKEVKIRPQRFDRLYLAELALDSAQTTIKLRAEPDGSGAGFDLNQTRETARVRLTRIPEAGASPDSPYEATGDDAAKLRNFHDALVAMVNEVSGHKKSLVKALLDGTPLDQVDSPRTLVDRLIASIAPTVHEIAKHSLAPGELVLKRLLSDSRREEIFVSTAELEDKLQSLSPAARKAFEPLGLSNHRPSARAPGPTAADSRAQKTERTSEGSWRPPAARTQSPLAGAEVVQAQPVVMMSPAVREPSQSTEPLSPTPALRPSQPPRS